MGRFWRNADGVSPGDPPPTPCPFTHIPHTPSTLFLHLSSVASAEGACKLMIDIVLSRAREARQGREATVLAPGGAPVALLVTSLALAGFGALEAYRAAQSHRRRDRRADRLRRLRCLT